MTDVIDGAMAGLLTVKFPALVASPPGAITETGPVVAPSGTVVVIWLLEFRVKTALLPLNHTKEAPVKFVPFMTTLLPALPLVGETLVMPGAGKPSTFARNTAAMLAGTAVKKAKPVFCSICRGEIT